MDALMIKHSCVDTRLTLLENKLKQVASTLHTPRSNINALYTYLVRLKYVDMCTFSPTCRMPLARFRADASDWVARNLDQRIDWIRDRWCIHSFGLRLDDCDIIGIKM
jgi:hypothetical protein